MDGEQGQPLGKRRRSVEPDDQAKEQDSSSVGPRPVPTQTPTPVATASPPLESTPDLATYRMDVPAGEPASKRARKEGPAECKVVSPRSESGATAASSHRSYFPPFEDLKSASSPVRSGRSSNDSTASKPIASSSSAAPDRAEFRRRAEIALQQKYGPHASPALPSPGLSSFAGVFKRPKLASSASRSASSDTKVAPGDELRLEEYRDVRVVAVHYDDVIACRAISTARDDQRVLLKFSLLARPSVATHFKAEVLLLNKLRSAGVTNISKPLAREHGRFGSMIVALDEDLRFWSELYLRRKAVSPRWEDPGAIANMIDCAVSLVRLLNSVHALGLVHASIRPTTISTSPAGEVFLHDFSCAYTADDYTGDGQTGPSRERGLKEESLPYLAPEASGRLGTAADYRSDFYSVGCALYEVFTGQVPFADAFDPLEILHAHIARLPQLMTEIEPSVPLGLSHIVAKLLEKNVEARYQTGQGLIIDLERVASLVRAASAAPAAVGQIGADFAPGVVDRKAHFSLPPTTQLFGREEHLRHLRASFERVKETNRPGVVVVKGSSGVGKTSLIETLRPLAVSHRGHFTMSKFDQIKSPVPFFAVTQALSGLVRQLLAEPEVQLVLWRRRLMRAIAGEGRILADILPLVEQVFEANWLQGQPDLPTLSPQESEERTRSLLLRVLRVFARASKPLVVVFDDLQWSTPSDLAFIRSLTEGGNGLTDEDPLHCKMANPTLVLCVFRDNEVGPDHCVNTELLQKLAVIDRVIQLPPLDLASIVEFVGIALHQPATASIRRLGELILARTAGSPLFVAQLLRAFHAEGSFLFDFDSEEWRFDLSELAEKTISTDVVDLLIAQILRYPSCTHTALQAAACLGNEEIDAERLATAVGAPVLDIARDLRVAVQDGLLLTSEETVTGSEPASRRPSAVPARYRFYHDRVQQAAYATIPPDGRARMHYAIGCRLASALSTDEVRENIFELVQQMNSGLSFLSTTTERDMLARYNYIAAERASASTAFEPAHQYLLKAVDLLGAGAWTQQHELMSKVVQLLVEIEYSLTDYAAAQTWILLFLEHTNDIAAKLGVYVYAIRSAAAVGDSMRAIELGSEGLALAGLRFPGTSDEADEIVTGTRARLALSCSAIDVSTIATIPGEMRRVFDQTWSEQALADLAPDGDSIAAGCQQILAALVPPVYFVRIELLGGLSSLSLNLSLRHGLNDAGAFVLTLHAILVRGQFGEQAESLAYGRTAVKFFDSASKGSPLACPAYKVYSSHVAVWALPIEDVLVTFRQSIAYGLEYRDAEYLGFGTAECCAYSMLFGGKLDELSAELERYAILVRQFRNELSSTYIGVIHQTVLCLVGRSLDPRAVEGEAFGEADLQVCRERSYSLTILLAATFGLMLALLHNDRDRLNAAVELGRAHVGGGEGLIFPVFFRLFQAIATYRGLAVPGGNNEEKDLLQRCHDELDGLAREQPRNFRPFQLWLGATQAATTGDPMQVLAQFDLAIESASTCGITWLVAYLNEQAANLLANVKLGAGYLFESREQWQAWGCLPKVAFLDMTYPSYFPSPPALQPTTLFSTTLSLPTATRIDWPTPSFAEPTVTAPGPVRRRPSTPSHEASSRTHSLDIDLVSQTRSSRSDGALKSQLAVELDLRTVVSASGVISSELSVEGVVSKLLRLALRVAGAEQCLLVLQKDGGLCAEAVARSDAEEVEHLRQDSPIDLHPDMYPCGIINLTARSQTAILNTVDSDIAGDPYLRRRKPKSVLSLALASQQRVVGVLYMENSHTPNAFTQDRLEILTLISGQAAAAIEKTRLLSDLKKSNDELLTTQRAIESANRNLESKIAQRTAQLRQQNQLLEAEVSQREHAQAEMREAKEVAEAATAQKSQFLANMSHEIRTPFNAVVALSGLLLETSLTPVQADYVETIKNSAQELLVVLNDILDYSKIELDHLELSSEPVRLRPMLESCLDMVAERAATKSIELALVIEEGDIAVTGDLARLRQITVNLASNAIKFTKEGEVVVIASSRPAEADEAGRPRRWCRVSVKDTGIGIAKENFGRLFRVFSQAEGAETSRNFGGTGLGLAISRKLARLMDGDLIVESEIGKGSTFTFEWLAVAGTVEGEDAYAPSANRDLAGKRVLVVDANETSRLVLRQLLTSFGLAPTVPEAVSDAFDLANKAHAEGRRFDLVIVDAFLPAFGAQLLLRRLRQADLDVPKIALTRMGSPIHDDLRQQDCHFLIKPIKRSRLHHTIRSALPSVAQPSRPASPAPATPTFPALLATRNPLSILVAEDNPINVKVITHLLKRMGYSCEIAEDGVVATEKAAKKRYDLILMDLNMPRMDGLDATRAILASKEADDHRPYIVCLTANAMAEDRARCLEAGADGYISKPILIPELVAALNDAGAKRAETYGPVPVPLANGIAAAGSPIGLDGRRLRFQRTSRRAGSQSGLSNSSSTNGQESGATSPSAATTSLSDANPPR